MYIQEVHIFKTFKSFTELKTNVNLFRILIAYLSGNETLLKHKEPDKSYIVIKEGAPFGVYEYIDDDYKNTFKKYSAFN